MSYHVDCPCGASVPVEETAAGTKVLCECGSTVLVPSLRELRQLAGVAPPQVSPEMEVEALLLAGKLPEELRCVLCGEGTSSRVTCKALCESARVDAGPSWWTYVFALLAFGWISTVILNLAGSRREGPEWGKDRIYALPLCVCARCRPQLAGAAALRDALCRVPLYRRLLVNYPKATLSLLED